MILEAIKKEMKTEKSEIKVVEEKVLTFQDDGSGMSREEVGGGED